MTLQTVVDPNVLVSALISPNGVPARILTASEEGRFRLVVSERLVVELRDVLVRPKFHRYGSRRWGGLVLRRTATARPGVQEDARRKRTWNGIGRDLAKDEQAVLKLLPRQTEGVHRHYLE